MQRNVIPAPQWLVERMRKLSAAPPRPLEEVKEQLRANEDALLPAHYRPRRRKN